MEGRILPTVIDVSAPVKALFCIDPNAEEKSRFISASLKIKNNSNAPVEVKIAKGDTNFTILQESEWHPVNVLPNAREWNKAGEKISENYIALGIKVNDGAWKKINRTLPLYVAQQDTKSIETSFGEVEGNSAASLSLVCSHGLAFSGEKECTYRIIWTFSLGE